MHACLFTTRKQSNAFHDQCTTPMHSLHLCGPRRHDDHLPTPSSIKVTPAYYCCCLTHVTIQTQNQKNKFDHSCHIKTISISVHSCTITIPLLLPSLSTSLPSRCCCYYRRSIRSRQYSQLLYTLPIKSTFIILTKQSTPLFSL